MRGFKITTVIALLFMTSNIETVQAQNATGYAGYFSSPNGIGIYGYSSGDRLAPNPLAPGVLGESRSGVGVYGRGATIYTSESHNEGGYFEGGKGLYARGTASAAMAGYGARIYSSNYRGMYAEGASGYFDAYFGGGSGISTRGVVDRVAAQQSLVVNLGDDPIEPGDLVAMAGITPSPEDGQPMLGVAKLDASNLGAVIGVVKHAVLNRTVTMEDGRERVEFQPIVGSVESNGYLVIVTGGLAPAVNLSSLVPVSTGKVGDRIALLAQADGEVIFALNSQMSRSPFHEPETVIGKMAGPIDEVNRTIPMFIDID